MRVIRYKSCGICSCFPSELSEDNCYLKKFFKKKDFAWLKYGDKFVSLSLEKCFFSKYYIQIWSNIHVSTYMTKHAKWITYVHCTLKV